MKKTILFLAILGFCNLWSQDGILDPSFGNNGIVTTNIPLLTNQFAKRVCVQSDNKIVIGLTVAETGNTNHFCILRYLPDGAPDDSFGTNGMVITEFPNWSLLTDIALVDDKIIAVGTTTDGTQSMVAMAKYTDDGSPDTTFGIDGKVTTAIINPDFAYAKTVKVFPDGKIFVAGSVFSTILADYTYAFFCKFLPDGTADSSFGVNGVLIIPDGPGVQSVAFQSDSKIIISALTFVPNYFIFRFNADGSLDTSFGNNGSVNSLQTIGANTQSFVSAMAVLEDDSLLIHCRNADMFNNFTSTFVKYTPDGAGDSSFGTNGVKYIPYNSIQPTCMLLDSDQKTILGGTFNQEMSSSDFAVARINADASFDNSFGTNGITSTAITTDDDVVYAIAFQDQRLIAFGSSNGIALTRYTLHTLSSEGFEKPKQRVYPNPAEDFLYFSSKFEDIAVFDLQGRLIKKYSEALASIEISDLLSGVYVLSYRVDGENFRQKFIRK